MQQKDMVINMELEVVTHRFRMSCDFFLNVKEFAEERLH